jgi:drug/metabolite transporter (DMT)-like permease
LNGTEQHGGQAAGRGEYFAILFGATLLMGSSFVAGKLLLSAGFPPLLLAGARFFLAALACLIVVAVEAGLRRRVLLPRELVGHDWLKIVSIGLLQTGGVMGLLFWAMRDISAPMAAVLLFTNPIWVALLARLVLLEPLPRARGAGLALGALGVALALGLSFDVGGGLQRGQLIALGSAWCWAIATLINKHAKLKVHVWVLSFWQMLIGSLALLVLGLATGERWPLATTGSQWAWFLWLAIPASTGSFGLWFMALARGGATRTSGYLFLAPLFAVLLSHWLLGTQLSAEQGVGGLLIGLGIWLASLPEPRSARYLTD